MGIIDLFWLFLIISAVQPLLRQKVLEVNRFRLLRAFEKSRGSRVIALIHRQETMSFLGFPLMRYIDVNDSEEVLRAIRLTDPDSPIDLIIHTPGGLVLAAGQIAQAQFMTLFPQPTRTRPTVEYIPLPYPAKPGQGAHSA